MAAVVGLVQLSCMFGSQVDLALLWKTCWILFIYSILVFFSFDGQLFYIFPVNGEVGASVAFKSVGGWAL